MKPALSGPLDILAIFLGIVLLLEVGRRLGRQQFATKPELARSVGGTVEGAVFGMISLLIAFTFSGAALRFETRRSLIVQEANDIRTAWQRLDLLPVAEQSSLRLKFREYTEARLAFYRKLPDVASAIVELARAKVLQNDIWQEAVTASRDSTSAPASVLLLPALNQMISTNAARTVAAQTHMPIAIFVMLGLLVMVGSLLAGYGLATAKSFHWFHAFAFALVMAAAIYVILDFEYPRLGLIRIEAYDQVLADVRQSMGP